MSLGRHLGVSADGKVSGNPATKWGAITFSWTGTPNSSKAMLKGRRLSLALGQLIRPQAILTRIAFVPNTPPTTFDQFSTANNTSAGAIIGKGGWEGMHRQVPTWLAIVLIVLTVVVVWLLYAWWSRPKPAPVSGQPPIPKGRPGAPPLPGLAP